MGEFVGEQPLPCGGVRGILPRGESNVSADGERLGSQRISGVRRARVGMDTDGAEVNPQIVASSTRALPGRGAARR